MIRVTAGTRSRVKKAGAIRTPAGAIATIPASGRSGSSASRSPTHPPSELPATTILVAEASAAASTAAAANSTSWSSTGPEPSGGAVPNPAGRRRSRGGPRPRAGRGRRARCRRYRASRGAARLGRPRPAPRPRGSRSRRPRPAGRAAGPSARAPRRATVAPHLRGGSPASAQATEPPGGRRRSPRARRSSADDLALDLVGAAVDRHHQRRADVALHVVLGRVTVTAHHLHALERDLLRRPRSPSASPSRPRAAAAGRVSRSPPRASGWRRPSSPSTGCPR